MISNSEVRPCLNSFVGGSPLNSQISPCYCHFGSPLERAIRPIPFWGVRKVTKGNITERREIQIGFKWWVISSLLDRVEEGKDLSDVESGILNEDSIDVGV